MGLWQLGRVVLEWHEPGPTHGLRIVMRRRPLGELADLWEKPGAEDDRKVATMTRAEKAKETRENSALLAGLILEWNIAGGDGELAPITGESLLAYCDLDTINDIWDRYTEATTRVAPPLPSSSDGGQPSEETALQLPTEPLSDSPA